MPVRKFHPTIDAALLDRARAAVTALRDTEPDCRSLNLLVETALRYKVERLERLHNDGRPFPAVESMPGSGGRR